MTLAEADDRGSAVQVGAQPPALAERVQSALAQARSFDGGLAQRRAATAWPTDDPTGWTVTQLAGCLDQTLLRPETTPLEMEAFLRSACAYPFAALCVQPCYVAAAHRWLTDHCQPTGGRDPGGPARVAAVVAFPQGASLTRSKVEETRAVVSAGADEVDVVANLGWIRGQEWSGLADEIAQVVAAAAPRPVKVILECAALPREQWAAAAAVAAAAGAAYVKTSTGYGPGGARVEDVALLRQIVGSGVGVKAAGGIRQPEAAIQMLRAGANRIGTSHGVAILQEWERRAAQPAPGRE